MAIATYSDLTTAVGDWLNRADLAAVVPSFVSLCEAELNRRLRTFNMVTRSDASVDAQYIALPSDFLEMRSFYLKTDPIQKLQFLSNEEMARKKMQGFLEGGKPNYFTIVGNTAEFLPVPGQAFNAELVYYAKVPSLSGTTTTNWLLTSHPDIYLYGSLMQSAPYLRDDERVGVWSSLFEKGIEQLRIATEQAEFTGGVLKTRARNY